ncbi:MAG: energy-coupling factor ABC transporter permease [Nitrospirota bacterium]
MHMADALLSPAVGATFAAGSLAAIAYASKKLKSTIDDKTIPLMGVLGAFIFAAQMINFTIPGTGSSGHLGGGMILAILLGPYAGFLVLASVLTVQAFFFADGGLLALGCNIWNLGVYPCFLAFPLLYKPLLGNSTSHKKILIASLISAIVGLQLGAFSVVLQTLLSGRTDLPFNTFLMLMQPIHLVIGIVEGFITAGVISYVRNVRPELLEQVMQTRPLDAKISIKKILIAFFVLSLVTGGALSWFASTHPDGLEWSLAKVTGKEELSGQHGEISGGLKKIQDTSALFPDYTFKSNSETKESGDASWPGIEPGTSVAGIIGALLVLGFVFLAGISIKAIRKKQSQS